jgi:hypothetical protein
MKADVECLYQQQLINDIMAQREETLKMQFEKMLQRMVIARGQPVVTFNQSNDEMTF